jgi:biotin operon repressor
VIHDTHKINFGEFRSNWDNTKVREHNLTKIIKSLEEGPKSHNKLCKDSNIGRSSIRKCIDQLIREGIVTETECGSKKMVQLISEYDARGEIQAVVV